MTNARSATRIAIIIGAGVGSLAAVMGRAPQSRPPAPQLAAPAADEARTASSQAPSHEPVVAPTGSPSPAPRPTVSAAGPPAAAGPVPPTPKPAAADLDGLPRPELERRCAFNQPRACLASARAFDSGRGGPADAAKARVYRALAVSLLDERCWSRDPESCHDLAGLYQTGTGMPRNPATATVLTQRARELCAGKTTSFCERLGGWSAAE